MTLHLAGTCTIWAAPSIVWAALHDAETLFACVSGCRTLTRASHERFEVQAEASLGPVSAVLAGFVEIVDSDVPRRLCLRGRGSGAAIFAVSGTVEITLSPCVVGCHVDYNIMAEPLGRFTLLGGPLLVGLAQRQIDQFVRSFAATVGVPPAACRKLVRESRGLPAPLS